MGQLPIEFKLLNRKLNFMQQLKSTNNESCKFLLTRDQDMAQLLINLNLHGVKINVNSPFSNWKPVVWKNFENTIANLAT